MSSGSDFVSSGREFIQEAQATETLLLSAFESLFSQKLPPVTNTMMEDSMFIKTIREANLTEYDVILEDLFDAPPATYNVSVVVIYHISLWLDSKCLNNLLANSIYI